MVKRLIKLRAPVIEMAGDAVTTAARVVAEVPPLALNFVFLDPYSIRALDFQILQSLSALKYIDVLVHLSKMDLQRNLDANMQDDSDFDVFAPGWRAVVDQKQGQAALRTAILEYWRSQIETLGATATRDARLIRGPGQIPLYWLLLVAKHELAMKFWKVAANPSGQGTLL